MPHFNVKSILEAGFIAGGEESKEGRHIVFCTDETQEEFNNDLSRPRKVHNESKWKVSQDAVS